MFHWNWTHHPYLISEWIIRLVMLVYVPQRRSTAATRTWLLLIFLLPWPGLVLYMLFGRIHVPRFAHRTPDPRLAPHQGSAGANGRTLRGILRRCLPISSRAAALAQRLGDFEPMGGNTVELLPDYAGSLDRLVADIDAAAHHVHLLFYIFEADATGRRVADAVIRAAKRGVKCRVLMDAVGSKRGLARLAPLMRANGIEVNAMLPVGLFRRNAARFDLRNHRKIAVIDGHTGYIGSQNIADPVLRERPPERGSRRPPQRPRRRPVAGGFPRRPVF